MELYTKAHASSGSIKIDPSGKRCAYIRIQIIDMELIAEFEAAVVDSKLLPSKPDNETLLKLYSLYKQATEGDAPAEGPSNPFDFVGRAKHGAWSGLAGTEKAAAMGDYIALIGRLKG